MSQIKIEELETAAFLQDIVMLAEDNGILSLLPVLSDAFPDCISSENVKDLLSGEHELSWILNQSERICIGNDGGGSGDEKHLESIVSSLSLFETKGESAYLALDLRSEESCLPGREDKYDLISLFSALEKAVPGLRMHNDFISFYAALDSMIEHYCSSMPSKSSGVSLYQRAKIKVAIASSIFSFTSSKNFDKDVYTTSKPFVLLSGDATGIQKYIFGVKTYKYSVKLIRARSFQIWIQSFLIAGHICYVLGLTNSNIISFSGGKFLLLLPNLDDLDEKLKTARQKVDNLCLDSYSGEIAYVISKGIRCNEEDLDSNRFSEIQKRIRLDGADAKQKKLQAGIASRKDGHVFEEQYSRLSSSGDVCICCGNNPVWKDGEFCRDCNYLIELGRLLNKQDYNIYLNFKNIGSLDKTVLIRKPDGTFKDFVCYTISHYEPAKARISMPYYVPVDEETDEVKTFEELAKLSVGIKKLAMFKADVDYLGLIFSSSLKDRWSLSRYASLSAIFHFYFSESLVSMIKRRFPNLYVVFSGGDDVCILGPWNEIMEFAEVFNASFHRFTCDNPSLSVSAGIVMFDSHDPIAAVADEAEKALEESKSIDGKNSITLFSRTISWKEYSEQLANAKILQAMQQISKKGFLYRLLSYSDSVWTLQHEGARLSNTNMKKALWLSHYTYVLRRNTIKDESCAKLLSSYLDPNRMMNAKIAVTIALYANRGGKNESE